MVSSSMRRWAGSSSTTSTRLGMTQHSLGFTEHKTGAAAGSDATEVSCFCAKIVQCKGKHPLYSGSILVMSVEPLAKISSGGREIALAGPSEHSLTKGTLRPLPKGYDELCAQLTGPSAPDRP